MTRKSLSTASDVSAQHVNEAERMDSEGGMANHTQSTFRKEQTQTQTQTHSRRSSTDKLSLKTEGLETSNMSEKEIRDLALERSKESSQFGSGSSLEETHQPIAGLSYASVVKEATPSQGPVSGVPESILSRQAAEAMKLEKQQSEMEKQLELEQVQLKEELSVPTSTAQQHLQHPIIPVVLNLDQAKTMDIEISEKTTVNFIHPALEQHIETVTIQTVVETAETDSSDAGVASKLKAGAEQGAEQIKSNLNSALDKVSSTVTATTSSPLQKARDMLTSVSETVKSKLPWSGSSSSEEQSEEVEEVEEEDEDEQESAPSTIEQLKTQASQLSTMASNKVSSLLPISLKSASAPSTADVSAKANEVASAASNKAGELKGKAQSVLANVPSVEQVKEKVKSNVPSVEQLKAKVPSMEQGKQQLKQQLQQGKEQVMEKLPSGAAGKKQEGKQQASKKVEQTKQQASQKLEQGKQQLEGGKQAAKEQLGQIQQMANEKAEQVKQLANEKLGAVKKVANEKVSQAKELAPQMQQKGQQLKEKANEKASELKNKKPAVEESVPSTSSTLSSKLSAMTPDLNKLLSNITDRATDLRNQATETATNLSSTVTERLPSNLSEVMPNLSEKLPNLSNLTEKLPSLPSLKSSASETVQQGKKKVNKAKKQAPSEQQQWQLVGEGKKKLNMLSNQAAETLSNLKEQGLSAVQSSGLVDQDNNLHLREGLESSLRKLQGQSQFQSLKSAAGPYWAKGRTFASNYVQSYTDFLYTLKEQNYTLLLTFGLMAVMHVFIPLLFLDYPQARMTIKWYSFVAIFSHAIFYFSNSLKLVQLPNVLLYPLITYLLMLSPMMGEGLSAGTGSVFSFLPSWLSWLSVLGIPFQARSYFFTLWLRTLLMLDSAVLTWNFMQAQSFMRKHGGTISSSLKSYFQSEQGQQIVQVGKQLKQASKPMTDMVKQVAKPMTDMAQPMLKNMQPMLKQMQPMMQNVQSGIQQIVEVDNNNDQEQGEDVQEQEQPTMEKKHKLKSQKSVSELPTKRARVEETEEETVEENEEQDVNEDESEDVEETEEEQDVPEQEQEQEQEQDVEEEVDEEEHEEDHSEHATELAPESFSKIDDLTVNKLQHMPLDRYASGKGMNKKQNGWDFSKENESSQHDELKWDDVQVPFSKQNEDELIAMQDGQLAK